MKEIEGEINCSNGSRWISRSGKVNIPPIFFHSYLQSSYKELLRKICHKNKIKKFSCQKNLIILETV